MEQPLNLQNELELFQSRLKQREEKITQWVTDQTKQIVANQTSKHEEFLREGADEIKKLNTAILTKKQKATERNQYLEEKCQQLEGLKAELLKLNSHTEELRKCQNEIENQKSRISSEIHSVKEGIEGQSKTREKLEYLNKACGSFEGSLGLTFKKTKNNRMQVIFTDIDEKDPSLMFYFFLQIQGASRKYVVTDPEPSTEGIQELVDKLNATNNIRAFMIEMRKKFKKTLKS